MKGTCIFLSLANVYLPHKNRFETNVKISNRIKGLGFVLLVAGLIQFPMTVVSRSTAKLSEMEGILSLWTQQKLNESGFAQWVSQEHHLVVFPFQNRIHLKILYITA